MQKFMRTTVLLASIMMIMPVMTRAESDMSRLNQERMVIGRALLEMQSDNWPALLPYYTEDIEYHDPIVDINGIDQMTQFLARLFGSSPNLITTVEDEICINDIYAASWIMDGFFNGVPYNAKGITIIKFRNRSTQVYYQRDYYTEGDIMINIPGLDEPIKAFRTYYRCAVDPTFDCPFGPAVAAAASRDMFSAAEDSRSRNISKSKKGEPSSDMSRINRERKAIGRALVEIQSTNWTSLLQYYAEDIEYNDPIVTIEGIDMMTQFLARLFASSPDLITTVEDEICINGIYMASWTMDGYFNGVPYTAKGMSIVKFRPGETQAYYSRDYYTEGDIMINIPGLDEPTEAFRTYYRCAVDPRFPCPFGPAVAAHSPGESITSDNTATFTLEAAGMPEDYELDQNYPNPFNPETKIRFAIPEAHQVIIKVYDAVGQEVRTITNTNYEAGYHTVSWNGKNNSGNFVPSGVYICRLNAGSFSKVMKMTLVR